VHIYIYIKKAPLVSRGYASIRPQALSRNDDAIPL
jgi:hypothetical protein